MKKNLTIGIDARLYNQTGVGRYIRNLLLEYSGIETNYNFIIYLRKKEYDCFNIEKQNFQKKILDVSWHSAREQIVVPQTLLRDHIDVAHFPYFNVPIFYTKPYLLTIHDLIIDHFDTGRASTLPKPIYRMKRMGYKIAVREGIKKASHITTISQTTKKEVMDHYFVPSEKITVTYDALDDHFRSIVSKSNMPKKLFNFPYILYVGNAYPHKNLERLLDAFTLLRKKNKDIKLVLAGDDHFFYPRLEVYSKKLKDPTAFIFFGMADDKQLYSLYTYAELLVFPSLMEGFGLPTFEAVFSNLLPVISDIEVFKEIWSDSLPMFKPTDTISIADGLYKTLQLSNEKKHKIVKTAQEIIERYSFKKTALQTLSIYQKIADFR